MYECFLVTEWKKSKQNGNYRLFFVSSKVIFALKWLSIDKSTVFSQWNDDWRVSLCICNVAPIQSSRGSLNYLRSIRMDWCGTYQEGRRTRKAIIRVAFWVVLAWQMSTTHEFFELSTVISSLSWHWWNDRYNSLLINKTHRHWWWRKTRMCCWATTML